MKKYNLIKPIAICFIVLVLLTWFIPAGSYTSGVFQSAEQTLPLGLADLIQVPMLAFSQLAIIGLAFLVIGGTYGVLNATEAYSSVVEGVVKKFKANPKTFLIATTVFFTVVSSLTGSAYVLFALVPFFVAVLRLLKFDKISTFTATVGGLLVGRLASTYGATVTNYVNGYFGLDPLDQIVTRIILLAIVATVLALFVSKTHKVDKLTKEDKEQIPLYVVKKGKGVNTLPLIITAVLVIIFALVGTFDWYGTFGIELFDEMLESITELKVLDYPLFANLLGNVVPLGQWTTYEITYALMIVPIVITYLYNIKLKDAFESFLSGVKTMLPVAFMVMLANVIFVALAASSTGATIYATMTDFVLNLTDGFNLASSSLMSILSGVFYNDFQYAVYNTAIPFQGLVTDTAVYSLMSIVLQTLHGLVMLIAPTSIFLVAGLSYLEISYKEWFNFIWKLVLAIFGILALVFIVIAIFL